MPATLDAGTVCVDELASLDAGTATQIIVFLGPNCWLRLKKTYAAYSYTFLSLQNTSKNFVVHSITSARV
jgi:hypothetical protein